MIRQVIPSIIAKTQKELEQLLLKVEDFSEIIHLDVMDGIFVENHSLDFNFALPNTSCRFEAHLMMVNPLDWIMVHGDKVETILIHYEIEGDQSSLISLVKKSGKKIGLVLNPEIPVENIKKYLDKIDRVLVMMVNPGRYGAEFLPEMLDKVKELRNLNPGLDIEVDGGISKKTIEIASAAGANLFVSGSEIINADNPERIMQDLGVLVKK